MRSYRAYLSFIFILYLVLIVLFHVQLHLYDTVEQYDRDHEVTHDVTVTRDVRDEPSSTRHSLKSKYSQQIYHIRSGLQPGINHVRQESHNLGISSPKNQLGKGNKPTVRNYKDLKNKSDSRDLCQNSKQPTNGSWPTFQFQELSGHFIYSAYYDERLPERKFVRVLALMQQNIRPFFYCHFPKYDDVTSRDNKSADVRVSDTIIVNSYVTVPASLYEMCENHNMEYGGWIISCPLKTPPVRRRQTQHRRFTLASVDYNMRPNHVLLTLNKSRLSEEVPSICVGVSSVENHTGFERNIDREQYHDNTELEKLKGLLDRDSINIKHDKEKQDKVNNLFHFVEKSRLSNNVKNVRSEWNHERPYKKEENNVIDKNERLHEVQNPDRQNVRHGSNENSNKLNSDIDKNSRNRQRVNQNFTINKKNTSKPESKSQVIKGRYCICVPPLFSHIPSTTLVEFIEFSRILGAHHIVFYLHDMSPEVVRTLDWYTATSDFITVIPWLLPLSDKTVWYNAQLLAINDCLYRTMYRFSHVAFNDIDEFIVPHKHSSWAEMIDSFDDITSSSVTTVSGNNQIQTNRMVSLIDNVGILSVDSSSNRTTTVTDNDVVTSAQHSGYSFQSAFFDPLVSDNSGHVMYDLESDLRTKVFSRIRTKVMVRPENVFELGIHHISRPITERHVIVHVEPNVAFVHHYRKCIRDFDPAMTCQVYAHDDRMAQFIPSLRHAVHQTLWQLKEGERIEWERRRLI